MAQLRGWYQEERYHEMGISRIRYTFRAQVSDRKHDLPAFGCVLVQSVDKALSGSSRGVAPAHAGAHRQGPQRRILRRLAAGICPELLPAGSADLVKPLWGDSIDYRRTWRSCMEAPHDPCCVTSTCAKPRAGCLPYFSSNTQQEP